ncbi:MAG: hypothetical protein JRI89_15030 [Deltaproteobacteria bacterium]|nr:hypothetical protein [Deltaproteobacteria bacterium]
MRNLLVIAVAAVFMLVGAATLAVAAQNVGNTSQKGSLLIFPKIDVQSGKDTIVFISNDYYRTVWLKCYWVDKKQDSEDFMFKLTANQPIWFNAKTGHGTVNVPPFNFGEPVGELKCWAVDAASSNQISWNHLWGTAKVVDFLTGTAYEYNSWNFIARGVTRGQPVGTGGELVLSGASGAYDACPKYLLFNFPAVSDYDDIIGGLNIIRKPDGKLIFVDYDLTVVPCKEDLRQDRKPTYTKLRFNIWNNDEVKYTGAYACMKCWYESFLSNLNAGAYQGVANGSEKFLYKNLHTETGRMRVQGIPSTVCPETGEHTGLVGLAVQYMQLISYAQSVVASDDVIVVPLINAVAGTNANGAGVNVESGFVKWDNEEEVPEDLR